MSQLYHIQFYLILHSILAFFDLGLDFSISSVSDLAYQAYVNVTVSPITQV